MIRMVTLWMGLALCFTALASGDWPMVNAEVRHLLDFLETSGCRFNRNNTWYDAARARAHLERKYDYLREKKRIGSAEDFIDGAATQSSLSGQPYRVQCGDGPEWGSGEWLRAELRRYRRLREGKTP